MTHWDMSPIGIELCREGKIYVATPQAGATGGRVQDHIMFCYRGLDIH